MNPVEIEQAISDLAESPFDAAEFPFAFLEAFGRKPTEIKRLRKGDANKSDLAAPFAGVLQRNNIHIATCPRGEVPAAFAALKASPATTKFKVKFILATDGHWFEAEDLTTGETVACAYADFPNFFGTFLSLAGISTVKQIRESAFDIKATGRLNRLYIELLKDNPDWGSAERRHDLNHFMARLIFCFFAEDTDIFNGTGLFTNTVDQMSNRDGSNVHEVIGEIFRAMDTPTKHEGQPDNRYRQAANLPRWADQFPYVNGSMFSGSVEVPRFSKIAQRYLSHIGGLDWTKINPDIFGSMIQAVADDDERSVLGMHYTSVPNILKVLNPLFLDDLNAALEEAGDNTRKLLNLRNRIARIRVFDPACGSGNFLVIAYKQMRAIEAEINRRRGEADRKSVIPLTNFRGIEIRDFSAEIARLALIIAEYQCDVTYRGQKEALAEFLPLNAENWITCGNALRLDWLSICPPAGTGVKVKSDDLVETPQDQAQVDFENEGGETYICGNPPYLGSSMQNAEQKSDLKKIFHDRTDSWKNFDYIAGWFIQASDFLVKTKGSFAFVSTNSICQGQQVPMLWPLISANGQEIYFAHTSFKWANLASHNAGVIVVVVGVQAKSAVTKKLYTLDESGKSILRESSQINSYLVPAMESIVEPRSRPLGCQSLMLKGNQPTDGGGLCLTPEEARSLLEESSKSTQFLYKYLGSRELIRGEERYCLWIEDAEVSEASKIPSILQRLRVVSKSRAESKAPTTRPFSKVPHRFRQIQAVGSRTSIVVPSVSSEARDYLPVGLVGEKSIISNLAFAIYDAPLWNLSVVASKIHLVWIATVCGKMKTDFRYSNTLGWNTFPVPKLTEKNREDLTRCAEDILLAREAHFPATIADLYDPKTMPADLRAAHDRNDEVLERIYIGRRFRNDTERLEKLFDMYTKMTTKVGA